jgi:hypothetical protein
VSAFGATPATGAVIVTGIAPAVSASNIALIVLICEPDLVT